MLQISQSDLAALAVHGEETYPHECCGVLLGHRKGGTNIVVEVIRCGNTRTGSPQTRYNIDPHELVRIQSQARERHLEIVGFYHSHPDHPARWSSTDLEEAYWVDCSYVITSVEQGHACQTSSFRLVSPDGGSRRLEEEPIISDL